MNSNVPANPRSPAADKATLIARDKCSGTRQIRTITEDPSERATLHRCYTGQIPVWKEGGMWCMRPSRYYQHIAEQENATLARRQSEQSAAKTA
jgi:hypothetical protein